MPAKRGGLFIGERMGEGEEDPASANLAWQRFQEQLEPLSATATATVDTKHPELHLAEHHNSQLRRCLG